MVLSPMSGLASFSVNCGKYSPCTFPAGAMNQRSGMPARRMPKSVPLRAITVTMVLPATPSAGSSMALPAGMLRFRKK